MWVGDLSARRQDRRRGRQRSELKVQPAARLDELEYLKVLLHESAALQLTDDDTANTLHRSRLALAAVLPAGVPFVQELQR